MGTVNLTKAFVASLAVHVVGIAYAEWVDKPRATPPSTTPYKVALVGLPSLGRAASPKPEVAPTKPDTKMMLPQSAKPTFAAAPKKAAVAKPSAETAQQPVEVAEVGAEGGDPDTHDGLTRMPEDAVVDEAAEAVVRQASDDDGGSLAAYQSLLHRTIDSRKEYPTVARRSRLQGTVYLDVVIDKEGRVVQASLAQSSGHDILDRAALRLLQSIHELPKPPRGLSGNLQHLQIPLRYMLGN